ncbi:tumor necrosis factor receptor superfamily member 5 [Esox lucius]|uniref:TNFR-Cys domain-containing protein n=1 Tax=Esox lucius TaxID=8010 RepID=A0A3P9AC23_ESOLU|nr:tumor necrosis factor receptor superfamily member 5 [Esox lucius]XP_010867506.1 tumor necrosis factor receptor superfamily member 5 [Esox lucius]
MTGLKCHSNNSSKEEGKCKCCPKGQYVQTECDSSRETTCAKCPHDTYAAGLNYMNQCLPCRFCNGANNQRVLTECKASSDRQCECVTGFYCADQGCDHCLQVDTCPLGYGVLNRATRWNNTVCVPCQNGTYSNVTDALTPCQPHTRCEALRREVKVAGTDKADAVCGDFLSECPWILPASLWAGLAVSLLIFILISYWRAKRPSYSPANSSDKCIPVKPAFPPFPLAELNFPTECYSQYHERQDEKGPEPHFLNTDVIQINDCMSHCLLETDGPTISITPSEPVSQPDPSTTEHNRINIGLTSSQSEPQEDEWPGT